MKPKVYTVAYIAKNKQHGIIIESTGYICSGTAVVLKDLLSARSIPDTPMDLTPEATTPEATTQDPTDGISEVTTTPQTAPTPVGGTQETGRGVTTLTVTTSTAGGLSAGVIGAITGVGILNALVVLVAVILCLLFARSKAKPTIHDEVESPTDLPTKQEMELTQVQAHAHVTDCVTSNDHLYDTVEDVEERDITQNQAFVAANIPVETHGDGTTPTDPVYATVEDFNHEGQQRGMELTQNEAYVATNISVQINQCYRTSQLMAPIVQAPQSPWKGQTFQ